VDFPRLIEIYLATPPVPPSTSSPLQTSAAKASVFARRALLNEKHEVYGYTLSDIMGHADQSISASDSQLLLNVLTLSNNKAVAGQKTIFVTCRHESLDSGDLELATKCQVVLEISALPEADDKLVQRRLTSLQVIKRCGFRFAFDESVLTPAYASWLPLASFVKFDIAALDAKALGAWVKSAKDKTTATLIAENVETAAQHANARAAGFRLFRGQWFAALVLAPAQEVRPAQASILQLINLVRQQASDEEIEELFKREPTLSFILLRFINSAGFGMRTEVTSFRHAVMLLGHKRLFKWAALLMTNASLGGAPQAVGATAVVRGRLMELLTAPLLSHEESESAFVVGVFSLLDTMLSMSMESALVNLSLPANINDALLHRGGPLAPFLELTLACESGDCTELARLASALSLDGNDVNRAHLQALSWAETLGD